MNMPGFTAAATLYKTSGHYQTSRNMINLPTQMIRAAMERIEVEGCRPGFLQLGEGENMVCIDPFDPFGTGGHDGGGGPEPSDGGGGGKGSGGGGTEPPPPKPKPPKNTNCECQASGCDPTNCRWKDVPGSSVQECTGHCTNSEGLSCGACQEVAVPPKAHRILRTKGGRLL